MIESVAQQAGLPDLVRENQNARAKAAEQGAFAEAAGAGVAAKPDTEIPPVQPAATTEDAQLQQPGAEAKPQGGSLLDFTA